MRMTRRHTRVHPTPTPPCPCWTCTPTTWQCASINANMQGRDTPWSVTSRTIRASGPTTLPPRTSHSVLLVVGITPARSTIHQLIPRHRRSPHCSRRTKQRTRMRSRGRAPPRGARRSWRRLDGSGQVLRRSSRTRRSSECTSFELRSDRSDRTERSLGALRVIRQSQTSLYLDLRRDMRMLRAQPSDRLSKHCSNVVRRLCTCLDVRCAYLMRKVEGIGLGNNSLLV